MTAIANDYGFEELFARQVRAHARTGDVLMLLSTSGKSPNLLRAAETAARLGVTTWALTGPGPNPLAASLRRGRDDRRPRSQRPGVPPDRPACRLPRIRRRGRCGRGRRDTPHGGRAMKIVVVGDVLLDVDLDGQATRLCPDAPVPVVDVANARRRAGGAGLVARMLADDGHRVVLVTVLGRRRRRRPARGRTGRHHGGRGTVRRSDPGQDPGPRRRPSAGPVR